LQEELARPRNAASRSRANTSDHPDGERAMKMAGFTAEASVYRTAGRYFMVGVPVRNDKGVYPALQSCPPECVSDCVTNCRRDGLSLSFCQKLCESDCSSYSSLPLSCGPCVNSTRTCILCGGQMVTERCSPDSGCCPPGMFCCGGVRCCHDGTSCLFGNCVPG
jgi:hypothetical protein